MTDFTQDHYHMTTNVSRQDHVRGIWKDRKGRNSLRCVCSVVLTSGVNTSNIVRDAEIICYECSTYWDIRENPLNPSNLTAYENPR